eukprot:TRINITY_DN409_c0_g1_i3.p1 TRINITY_DN409_c0_g1~~TRINITY_DN409_c0_g1_i3.p1  ORF type:complete len:172 (-),score=28.03 TRINITY_DN409_c0_g1_i3:20-535(-)
MVTLKEELNVGHNLIRVVSGINNRTLIEANITTSAMGFWYGSSHGFLVSNATLIVQLGIPSGPNSTIPTVSCPIDSKTGEYKFKIPQDYGKNPAYGSHCIQGVLIHANLGQQTIKIGGPSISDTCWPIEDHLVLKILAVSGSVIVLSFVTIAIFNYKKRQVRSGYAPVNLS